MLDPWLAAGSFATAFATALTAVQLTYNLAQSRQADRHLWLLAGAAALGLGIWLSQFAGLLSWRFPVTLRFDLRWLALSALPVVLGSAIALGIVVSRRSRLQRITVAALTLALSTVLTLQLGFHAITFSREPDFDPVILLLSGLLALATTTLAMSVLSLRIQQAPMASGLRQRLSAALLIATGLAGVNFSSVLALEPQGDMACLVTAYSSDGFLLLVVAGSNLALYLASLMVISLLDRRRLLSTLALGQRKLRSARRFSEQIETQARELTLALQKSQQRMALAMEGSQDGLWDVDVPGNEVLISRRMAMMLGLGTQDLTLDSSAVLNLLDPAQRVSLLRALHLHWRSGLKRPLDCNLLVLSEGGGRRRSLHLRGSSVLGEQGNPLRVAGSLSDVTLQRQHERELRAYAALIEQHPAPLLVLELSGRVESANLAAVQLLGAARAVVVGRPLGRLLRRFGPRGALGQIRRAVLETGQWSGVVQARQRSGWWPIRLSVNQVSVDGRGGARLLVCAQLPAAEPPLPHGATPS